MRTVTFSNDEAAKSINGLFLPTWVNRRPGFHNCEMATERRILNDSYDCYATRNFCTFFATPDLEVLHYCSGYYSPRMFLREVEFVRELAAAVLDERNRFKKGTGAAYRGLHESRELKCAEERRAAMSLKPKAGDNSEFISRRDSLAEGLHHLSQVHRDLAARAAETGRPVQLTAVMKNHLFGNPFSEEEVNKGKR